MDWFLIFVGTNLFIFVLCPILFLYTIQYNNVLIHGILIVLYWLYSPGKNDSLRYNWLVQKITFDYLNFSVDDPHHTIEHSVNNRTIFLYHPHGVYAAGFFGWFAFNPSVRHISLGVSNILFRLPFIKDVMGIIDAIPVNQTDLVERLKLQSICICPGGLRELILYKNSNTQFLKRKGIIEIAQKMGVNVVLVIVPNEAELYSTWIPEWLYPIQSVLLRRFLYPFPVFSWGNPWIPWWPKQLEQGVKLTFSAPVFANPDISADDLIKQIYE